MKFKILIVIGAGCVQQVICNDDADIVIVDKDYSEVGDPPVSKVHGPDTITKEPFFEQFNDATEPAEVEVRDELKRMKF